MDLQYEMEGILHRPITVAVRDSKDKAAEALRHRAADDQWRPLNLHNKASRNKLLHELSELQVEIPPSFIRGKWYVLFHLVPIKYKPTYKVSTGNFFNTSNFF